jgi:pyridoxine 5-phosphate synthase
VGEAVKRLQEKGIRVSLFVDPEADQIEAGRELGATGVEIHTGRYCNAIANRADELAKIRSAACLAHRLGLEVHGGHGLDYKNVEPVAQIPEIIELNIGHSIVARAVMVGIERAVREMKDLLLKARG